VPNVYQFKDFAGSSHRMLLRLVRHFATPGGRLLDLGAAGGELGHALREHFAVTTGFEYDRDQIGVLRNRFTNVVIADLERIVTLPKNLDAIVLADVLEHLRDPAAILRMAHRSLNRDGHIFVSVPNIANVTIRLGLLFGVFTYRDRGILDHTHVRFYTARTIRREIENAGFEIVHAKGSAVPVRLIVGRYVPDAVLKPIESALAAGTQAWKSLLAYQMIIVARPRADR
jgi:2-polyprenyl-3-methyl-5-hydroxy-6-metoxy-1,4-benzoquinol methylase